MKKVAGLGALGDKVTVKPGYGRNYLIPTGCAVPATATNLKAFEAQRAELEKTAADLLANAQARKQQLTDLRVVVGRKAGDEGRLFGSIGANDIAAAITATGTPVEKAEVRLPNGALRVTGEHLVGIRLHTEVECQVCIEVVATH
nr:50S ribosomal protein L9 [Thiospirillum jenense]